MSTGTMEQVRAVLTDPVRYARKLMRADLWAKQADILTAIRDYPQVAVKACHASGKTFVAALAVLWWITRYKDGVAVTTAPTWLQVERLIWGEIAKACRNSLVGYPVPSTTELELAPGNYAIGLSTNEADRFQGFHGMRVLMVLDESPGVRTAIHEAIEGIKAGGRVHRLDIGNPIVTSGPFFEAFTTHRDFWHTMTVSAFDTPNFTGILTGRTLEENIEQLLALPEDALDDNPRPYLTTRRWVKEKWLQWGQHSNPLWESRVLGQFPQQATNALYPLHWLEAAGRASQVVPRTAKVRVGIDVAGPGEDETTMYILEGNNVAAFHAYNDPDPRGRLLADLRPWKARDPLLKVDCVGMGWYFCSHLEDQGYTVQRVNVGKASNDQERFMNKKAQFNWGLREALEEGRINNLTDEQTITQLSQLTYTHDPRGRVKVVSKDELTAKGISSPDRAEGLMLAVVDDQEPGGIALV